MPQQREPMTYKEAWRLAENLRKDHHEVEVYRDNTSKEYIVHVTGKIVKPEPAIEIDKM